MLDFPAPDGETMSSIATVAEHSEFGKKWTCKCDLCARITPLLLEEMRVRLLCLMERRVEPTPPARLWHYSNVAFLDANPEALMPFNKGRPHPPCVWFTESAHYEHLLMFRDLHFPVVKIAVDFDPDRYFNIYSFAGEVGALEFFNVCLRAVLAQSNPLRWWLSYSPVPHTLWLDTPMSHGS